MKKSFLFLEDRCLFSKYRYLIIMKLIVAMLFACFLQLHANTFAQTVTISNKEKHIIDVFREIKKQTGYNVICSSAIIKEAAVNRINFQNLQLTEALQVILEPKGLTYEITDKNIVIKKKPELAVVSKPKEVEMQQNEVTGQVRNQGGESLIGVSVVVKGKSRATASDQKGQFRIAANAGETLVFSSIGFITKEVLVSGAQTLSVIMEADESDLEEVVVVGYGTQKKTSVTAAVSTMNGSDIADLPTTNLSNNLGGRIAGVVTKQVSGEPGSDGSSIYIRGVATTGSTQPLLIVDGVPRSFTKLDPNVIESFTVLKDAAAVAPYGVAGANGVIIVTTKRGREGAVSTNYNGYFGFQNPTIKPDLVNGYEYALLRNKAAENEGTAKPYSDEVLQKFKDGSDPDRYPPGTPWDGLLSKNAFLQSHSVDFAGGNEKVAFFAGFGYQYQKGMWELANSKRYNLALNVDAKITPTTKVAFNINGNVTNTLAPPSDISDMGTLRIFELVKYAHAGTGPNVFSNGMFGTHAAATILGDSYRKSDATTLFSQVSVSQKIPFVEGLELNGLIAYDPTFLNNKVWNTPVRMATLDVSQDPYVIKDGIFGEPKASLNQSSGQRTQLLYQANAKYTRRFGDHGIDLIGVFEAKDNKVSDLGAFRRNYNLLLDEINMGSSSSADMRTTGSSSAARQVGLVYRASYDYQGKYMFEASGRYDGHYYFAPDKRWGFFPSFSAGWRISEEKFMDNVKPWLSNLKLRASFGEVGALAGNPFQYLGTYGVSGPGYIFGNNGVQIVTERAEPNLSITWERAKKTDVGLEFSLWNGLFEMEVDYFYEKRSNMLIAPTALVPLEYGIGLSQVNDGIMENKGIEFAGNLNVKVSDDWRLGLHGTFTYSTNKILQVFETESTYDNPNRRRTGKSYGMQFGYESMGYFLPSDFDANGNLNPDIAVQPWGAVKPGDIRYRDVNGDKKIDFNDEVPIGAPSIPRIMYGIAPRVSFRNISLDLLFQGASKVNYYFFREAAWPFWNGMTANRDNFDYWTPDNLNARHPRLTSAPTTNNTQTSSHWMQDVSYIRLKNVTLAYSLPEKIVSRMKLSNLQVYVSGQNLWTSTKAKNVDPEMAYDRGNNYPQQEVYSFGLKVGF